jgi:3'-phosphoadenosine 5'-phosphosulfate sulfotransferase (PAPS reductase)/FAD synthetase
MLSYVCQEADKQNYSRHNILAVHANLGRAEWKGVDVLTKKHADFYGVQLVTIKRPQGDLLDQVEARGKFPSPKQRYCTSDQKRGQIDKVFTGLTRESPKDKIRYLSCVGLRAAESPARSKQEPFKREERLCTKKRTVETWLPIHNWDEDQVWETIRASGLEYHYAYDLGMPRLSCVFCIFASKPALVLAGTHNPELLETYVQLEKRIDFKFKSDLSLADVQEAVKAGESIEQVTSWTM